MIGRLFRLLLLFAVLYAIARWLLDRRQRASLREFITKNLGAALCEVAFLPVLRGLAVVCDGEAYIGARQCDTTHDLDAVTIFRLFSF